MNKQELIKELAHRSGQTQTLTKEMIDTLLGIITEKLEQDEEIRLSGFATLTRWHQPSRPARNPKTGSPCLIPSRYSIKLKPGKYLLNKLNNITLKNKSK